MGIQVFVTVGAQMPFDRMVRAVDEWAGRRDRGADVFAQIGDATYEPRHVRFARFLEPPEFKAAYERADVIVAHAGTGSILAAMELGKPIVVMPRRAALRETRNDHQVATAERFQALGRIPVAWDERELGEILDRLDGIEGAKNVGKHASPELLDAIKRFIET